MAAAKTVVLRGRQPVQCFLVIQIQTAAAMPDPSRHWCDPELSIGGSTRG